MTVISASPVRTTSMRAASAILLLLLTAPAMAGCDRPAEPADEGGVGVAVDDLEPLEVRNALIVTTDGSNGAFVAAVVNNSDDALTLTVSRQDDPLFTVTVDPRSEISYGNQSGQEQPPVIEGLDTPAGATIDLQFRSEQGSSVTEAVPVLDESLDYLKGLAPDSE